jgi:hypothetical protein
MLAVVVALITGEEQQVGILRFEIRDDVGSWAAVGVAVARQVADDDLVLVSRVLANDALVLRAQGMRHAVTGGPRIVPLIQPECRHPAVGVDCLLGELLEFASLARNVQLHVAVFALLERIKLGRELERVVVDRVEAKTDELVAGHLGNHERLSLGLLLLGLVLRFILGLCGLLLRLDGVIGDGFPVRKQRQQAACDQDRDNGQLGRE